MKRCLTCEACFDSDEWVCPRCGWRPGSADGILTFAPELASTSEGFDPGAHERLYQLEGENYWFRSRSKLIVWALSRYFSDAQSLLEIGCGTGFVLSGIETARPELKLAASEVLSAGALLAQMRVRRARVYQMDACRLPFEAEFDVIGAFDVIEHIETDETVLHEVYRALRPGGGLLLTVPQHRFLWSAADEFGRHKRRYSRQELLDKAGRAGFHVLRCTSFVSLMMPAMLLSRLAQRDLARFDPNAEFRVPRPLNWTIEKILDFERQILITGVSFPFGGSLLLVAKKA